VYRAILSRTLVAYNMNCCSLIYFELECVVTPKHRDLDALHPILNLTLLDMATLRHQVHTMGAGQDSKGGPAYSKIAIGAVMAVGEGLILGHGLEQAKIGTKHPLN
jgi:hypothetical protein